MSKAVQQKCLIFTTSPRSPLKSVPEIKLLADNFEGRPWNKNTQAAYAEMLSESDFYDGSVSKTQPEFAARDRINRRPKNLGFVSLKPVIHLTPAGKMFIKENRSEEALLRQMLKYQMPSPFHPEDDSLGGSFWIRPYLELFRLIHDLDFLTFDELKLFGLPMINYHDFDKAKAAVIAFRDEKKHLSGHQSYAEWYGNKLAQLVRQIFAAPIMAGNIHVRESTCDSMSHFVSTKMQTLRDYADACFRSLSACGLFTISHSNRSIYVNDKRKADVEFILKTVPRDPAFPNDEEKYKEYLFDDKTPALYTDDIENLRSIIRERGISQEKAFSGLSIDNLKDLNFSEIEQVKAETAKKETADLKTYSLYPEIQSTFEAIKNRTIFDTSLMLEYNTWRSFTMLDDGNIVGRFRRGDDGKPSDTAPGKGADIVCDYGDFALAVEVTMSSGDTQAKMEHSSVPQHVSVLRKDTGKPTYCIFIAPTISNATNEWFFGLDKIAIAEYGGKSRMITMTLETFMRFISRANLAAEKPNKNDLRNFLDLSCKKAEKYDSADLWAKDVQTSAENWIS